MFEDYTTRIQEILASVDLNVVSAKIIRKQIEDEYQVDLSATKREFNDMVVRLLHSNKPGPSHALPKDLEILEPKTESASQTMEAETAIHDSDAAFAAALQREEDSNINNGSSSRSRKGKAAAKPSKKRKAPDGRVSGFQRPVQLSPELAELLNIEQLPRVDI